MMNKGLCSSFHYVIPIFDCLLYLPRCGLAVSHVKAHLASIFVSHHKIDGLDVFVFVLFLKLEKRFSRGTCNMFSPRKPLLPQWSFILVLAELMISPFEPLM